MPPALPCPDVAVPGEPVQPAPPPEPPLPPLAVPDKLPPAPPPTAAVNAPKTEFVPPALLEPPDPIVTVFVPVIDSPEEQRKKNPYGQNTLYGINGIVNEPSKKKKLEYIWFI